MTKTVASPDITTLGFSVLFDISTATPSVTVTNLSTVVDASNLQWAFELLRPNGYPIHQGNFTTPDIDGVAFTTFTFSEQIPQSFKQIEYSKTDGYSVKVSVKDSNGDIFELTNAKSLCKPNGNNGKNNFGAALITIKTLCSKGRLLVSDSTNLVYKGLTGNKVSTLVKLTYPSYNDAGDVLAPASRTSIPTTFIIKYEGDGHSIYAAHVYDYDLGDGFYVRIRYSFTDTFAVWCSIDLKPLMCEIKSITEALSGCNLDNAKVREDHQRLTVVTTYLYEVMLAMVQPLSTNSDIPELVNKIKGLLNVDCECCAPAGISNVGSVLTADASFTTNKVCGDMTLSFDVDDDGNIVLDYENVTYTFGISDDSDSDAFELVTSAVAGCNKTVKLKVDISVLATELLTEIQNNPTLLNILNSITQQSQLVCSDLDGGEAFDFSTCNYSTEISTSTVGAVVQSILINSETYTAPGGLLVTDASGIETWLNSLALGSWSAVYTALTSKTRIETDSNANIISTITTSAQVKLFTNNCGLICTVLQRILNYFNDLSLVQLKTGIELTVCRFKADGSVLSTTFLASANAADVAKYIADSICNVVTYASAHLLSCANLAALFADATDTTGNPDAADIFYMSVSGACQKMPLKNVALSIVKLIRTDNDVKNEFCLIPPCSTISDCAAVANLTQGSGTDTTQNYSWDTVAGAVGYKWSIDGTNYTNVVSTSAFVSGLTAATSYTFRVYPVYVFGDGVDCEVTDGFTTTNTGATCVAPANLVLDNVTDTSFRATWDAVTGATGYQTRINGGSYANIGLVLTQTVSGLIMDTDYNFEVRAIIGGTPCTETSDDDVTTAETINYTLSASYGMSIDSVTGTGVPFPALPSTGVNGTEEGYHTTMSGSLSAVITGATVPDTFIQVIKNGIVVTNIDISAGPGTYDLGSAHSTATVSDIIEIVIVLNTP